MDNPKRKVPPTSEALNPKTLAMPMERKIRTIYFFLLAGVQKRETSFVFPPPFHMLFM
jgi:hypothetical protein